MTPIGTQRRALYLAMLCAACAPRPQAKPAAEKPSTHTAAPPAQAPEQPAQPLAAAPSAPAPSEPPPPSAAAPKPPAHTKPRVIHPIGDSKDCIEMYGTCTPPPDRLCTSSAFVLSCGETGQLPTPKREWLHCVCN